MIITRTPLRISLGGGGTDVPSYYQAREYGFLVAAAISKYVYVSINKNFNDDIFLRYNRYERARHATEIAHPILRECLKLMQTNQSLELTSMADIPAGTGLGSSGAFTVGVLKALSCFHKIPMSNERLAELACQIEIERLLEPVGKQDQYIASIGGISSFRFLANGNVEIVPIEISDATQVQLEENLLLFFTGVKRSASDVLAEEKFRLRNNQNTGFDILDQVRDLGHETKSALERGNLSEFGALLTQQWRLKLQRQPSDLHTQIDEWIQLGIAAGASGGKLIGAGGGGFLLFFAEKKSFLRKQMSELGLTEVPFHFDYEGATVVVAR